MATTTQNPQGLLDEQDPASRQVQSTGPSSSDVAGAPPQGQPPAAQLNAVAASDKANSTDGIAATYSPAQRTVEPYQTVAGQLGQILSDNSPYIQNARARASEAANSRGLINSTIAAGAGERAAIEAALPIAQQDASTYGQASSQNQAATNEAGSTNANLQTQTILQGQRGQQGQQIAQIQGQYQQLIQSNASASQLFSNVVKNITDVINDHYTSAEQKQSALDKQTQLLRSGLAVIGGISNLDLGSLLSFDPNSGTPLQNGPGYVAPPPSAPAPASPDNFA